MTYSFVPISGPRQSTYAPMKPFFISSIVYRLVTLSSSALDSSLGLILTPPFAPPNGTSAIASLKVIKQAKASTSYRSMSAEYLVPPLVGKKCVEC